jgi:hypothetical protein
MEFASPDLETVHYGTLGSARFQEQSENDTKYGAGK